jgi:hypothetical protein
MAQEIDSDRINTSLPAEGLAVLGPNLVVGRCRCGGARVGEDHWPNLVVAVQEQAIAPATSLG